MPPIGLPKLDKKLRMMELWSTPVMQLGGYVSYDDPEAGKVRRQVIYATPTSGATITGTFLMDGSAVVGEIIGFGTLIVSDLPDAVIVHHVTPLLKCRGIENHTNEASKIGDTPALFSYIPGGLNQFTINKVGGDPIDAIQLLPDTLDIGANEHGNGFMIVGGTDIKSVVSVNGSYLFSVSNFHPIGGIKMHDLCMGVRIYFK